MEETVHWLRLAFDQVVAFLPNLIAGLVILLLGYIIAVVLAKATRSLAHRLGFDRFIARLGLGELRGRRTPSYFMGSVVLFVVMVATIMQTARAWYLTFVADGLGRIIAYVPHVLAASVVFALSLFLGNWARDRLSRPTEAPRGNFRLLPAAVRGAILAVGSFMALRELQIAPEIVNTAFTLTLAAAAVAAALAFGLGGRDVAGRIAQSWYERRRFDGGGARPPAVVSVSPP